MRASCQPKTHEQASRAAIQRPAELVAAAPVGISRSSWAWPCSTCWPTQNLRTVELARLAGMPGRPTAAGQPGERAGWVRQDAASGGYEVGPAVRSLALARLARQDVGQPANGGVLSLAPTCLVAVQED